MAGTLLPVVRAISKHTGFVVTGSVDSSNSSTSAQCTRPTSPALHSTIYAVPGSVQDGPAEAGAGPAICPSYRAGTGRSAGVDSGLSGHPLTRPALHVLATRVYGCSGVEDYRSETHIRSSKATGVRTPL